MATSKKKKVHLTLQKLLRGDGDARSLSSARASFSPDSYQSLIQLINSNGKLRKRLFHSPFPSSPAVLKNMSPILEPLSIEREFLWAKAYLLQYATNIKEFIELVENYEHSLLRSDFAVCEEILASVELIFGASLWLIKKKIALLQISRGLEAQKQYAKEVIALAPDKGFTAFITHFVSYHNEPTISADQFENFYAGYIKKLKLQAGVAEYVSAHILPGLELGQEFIANILRFEFSGAVIDYYETLINLSRSVISAGYMNLFPMIVSTLKSLTVKIQDPRAEMIIFELDKSYIPSGISSQSMIKSFDSFLRGDIEDAYSTAIEALESQPGNPDLIDLAARAASMRPVNLINKGEKLYERIIREMRSDYAMENNPEGTFFEIFKYHLNFATQAVADTIWGYSQREYTSDPLEFTANKFIHYCATANPFISPLRVLDFPTATVKMKYSELNRTLYGDVLPIKYVEAISDIEVNSELFEVLRWEEREFLKAINSLLKKQFTSALEAGKSLFESPLNYYKQKAIRVVAHCYVELGLLEEAIGFITSIYIRYDQSHLLPLEEIIELLDKKARRALSSNISLSIILDIYLKHISSEREHERRYAYEDFLFSNGVRRPSELREIKDRFDKQKLIYFLRYVAVESVMDVSTVFTGSRDIAQERVSVCRFLTELDTTNAGIYQDEIKSIIRRLMIQKRLIEVQQSKIYVDIDNIRKKADKLFRESFTRYSSLLKQNITEEQLELRKVRKEKARKLDIEGLLSLPLPRDEMSELFESMVVQLRDQFVSSTEHGLDGYLSVRIRHGTLQGQLRGALESAHLLTQRDSITGGYKVKSELLTKLNLKNNALKSRIGELLTKFTSEFDQLINEIINEWIQIKKKPADKGMFDFTLIKLHTDILASDITPETTFEKFLDNIFHTFFDILEFHLRSLRKAIATTAKQRAVALLTHLQAELEQLSTTPEVGELIRNTRAAQTELLRAFDRIIEWFHLSQSTDNEPFLIEDAIHISLESVRTFTQGIDPQMRVSTDKAIIVEGRLLNGLVDILSIIFENIIRHSDIGGRPSAKINIAYLGNLISINVENEIGKDVASDMNKQKIALIQNAIRENKYGYSISREGGTGFHKIWKILNHDFKVPNLGTPAELDFGFKEEGRFFVKFSLPTKEIGDEHSHS